MIRSKVITSLVCMCLVLCAQACGMKGEGTREEAVGGNSNQQLNTTQSGSQAGVTAPSDEGRAFRGTIDYKHRIEMRLVRAGERLSGSYVYEKVRSDINLNGTIDAKGSFTLQETDSNGKQTGTFKGTWSEPEGVAGATLEGSWTKAGGKDKLDFYLVEQHVAFSTGLKVVAKQINEENKKKKYTLAAEYPQIEGSTDANVVKFNKEVKDKITKDVNEWREGAGQDPGEEDYSPEAVGDDLSIRYDVALATDDLVSIKFVVSNYEHGAAHPNSYANTLNYDLKNDKQLALADLFQPSANYLEAISSYSINDLKRQSKQAEPDYSLLTDEQIEEGAAAKADNYQSWNITQKGLLITFDPYQVGPYAAGPQTVIVPYAALKEIIKRDGPLARFMK